MKNLFHIVMLGLTLSIMATSIQAQQTSVKDVPVVSVAPEQNTPQPATKKTAPVVTKKSSVKKSKESPASNPEPVIAAEPVVAIQDSNTPATQKIETSSSFSKKNDKSIGLSLLGFYDINTDYGKLYVDFATPQQTIKAAGLGFNGYFEYGLADHFSLEVNMGYARMLYSSAFKRQIKENYFNFAVSGHYYFLANEKLQPYAIGGIGMVVSTGGVAPTLDLGAGLQYMLNDKLSIKTEVVFRSAIIYHRAEGRIGFGYHF